ncbi:MAG TPA: hypothetical protein VGS17_01835 [Candidatus Limnocylindria bacterium]|nr:hypothetical protein [Candidatus Limnocylindria bacterium]
MTSRRAGVVAIVLGLAVSVWSWFGFWPLAAPVFYMNLSGLSLGIWFAGCFTAIVGVFLLFAGRGGPEDWGRP